MEMKPEIKVVIALNHILNASEDLAKEQNNDSLLLSVEVVRESSLWLEDNGQLLDLTHV